jgi:hypothetical protein
MLYFAFPHDEHLTGIARLNPDRNSDTTDFPVRRQDR